MYIDSISSDRLFLRKPKNMPKESSLAFSYTVEKRLGVGRGICDGVRDMVFPIDIIL